MERLRKGRDFLMAWVTAMDYSAVDYTDDRIRELEHQVKQLRDELMQTRMAAEAAGGGFEPSAPAREN
jgi:hypothetical protein